MQPGTPPLLNPTLTVYYDFDEGEGAFAVLALSQKFPVAEGLALAAGASLGVNFATMGLDADGKAFTGLYYGEVSLATSIPIAGRLSIDPRVAYAFGLGDGKDAIEAVSVDGKGTSFYASVAATIAF